MISQQTVLKIFSVKLRCFMDTAINGSLIWVLCLSGISINPHFISIWLCAELKTNWLQNERLTNKLSWDEIWYSIRSCHLWSGWKGLWKRNLVTFFSPTMQHNLFSSQVDISLLYFFSLCIYKIVLHIKYLYHILVKIETLIVSPSLFHYFKLQVNINALFLRHYHFYNTNSSTGICMVDASHNLSLIMKRLSIVSSFCRYSEAFWKEH